METRVFIVGAGIAGLTAAHALREAGLASVLVDKSRAVGGRMATRTIDDARFDHGAQHFGIRSDQFAEVAGPWHEEGVTREWFRAGNEEPRYVGAGGMRRIPEFLARELDVRTGTMVEGLDAEGTVVAAIVGDKGRIEASAAIITPPLPQALSLLAASQIKLATPLAEHLEAIRYRSCLAVMLKMEEPSGLPDGHMSLGDGAIAWIADNAHKGTSDAPSVTIHSTPSFAAAHLEDDRDMWTDLLVSGARHHCVAE
jgi:predicted NAD/FAD-dependent oxidoreductase